MKKPALNGILAFAIWLCVALPIAGCQAKMIRNPHTQHELFGRPWPTLENKRFLTSYRLELARVNNPHDLQRWAMEIIGSMPRVEEPVRIDLASAPLHNEPGQSADRSKLVGYVRTEPSQEPYVSILVGGSAAFGWYGLKVGKPTFRPSDNHYHYLEWIPGCYVYYVPPI